MTDLIIRPAEHDNDVIAIHGFLAVMLGPLLPGAIGAKESVEEIWRVANHECALMAVDRDGTRLVGTIGLVRAKFWWSKDQDFLANRWFAALPGVGAGKELLREAERIAEHADLELHIFDEQKGRLVILNKNPRRQDVNPFLSQPPIEPTHAANTTKH